MRRLLLLAVALAWALPASAQPIQAVPVNAAPLFGLPAQQGSATNPFTNVSFTGQALGPNSCVAYSFTAAPTWGFGYDGTQLCWNAAGSTVVSATASALTSVVPATVNRTGLGSTSTDGVAVVNTTAATGATTVQMSPRVRQRGNIWSGAASQTVDFFAEVLPASGGASVYRIGYSLDGAAAIYPLTLRADGVFSASGNGAGFAALVDGTGGGFFAGSGSDVQWYRGAASTWRTGASVTIDGPVSSPIYQSSGSGVAVGNVGANSCGTSAATIAGNQTSGVITVGATSGTQCRVTFTTAAPTARDCVVTDSTTTIATRATYVDTTHSDFLGAFVAGDLVTYFCIVR